MSLSEISMFDIKNINLGFNKNRNQMIQIPFSHIDWTSIEKVEYKGDKGFSYWQTIQYPGLRIRLVEYSISHPTARKSSHSLLFL